MTPDELGSRLWRLNNLYSFIDADGKLAIFKLNHVQRLLLKNLWYLNVILKSRQQGITTFMCILFLDLCLFKENVHCGIVAHRLPDAQAFFEDKIRFAYDNLPEEIRRRVTLVKDTSLRLVFSNGSKITVGVSLRSGTYQYLHISELGKICAQFPKKALEIKSGALNTIKVGQHIFIESTAEGRTGDFFDYCEKAQKILQEGRHPSMLEWRFHFFGWALDPKARLNPLGIIIPQELQEYFRELQDKHGIETDVEQRAWYTQKLAQQGLDMMYREFPATPEEAFLVAIKGAYYKQQMTRLRQQFPSRFGTVPWEPRLKVDTAWDLGMRTLLALYSGRKLAARTGSSTIMNAQERGCSTTLKCCRTSRTSTGHTTSHTTQM